MKSLKVFTENLIQVDGKKNVSEKLVFKSFKLVQKKTLKNFQDILFIFLSNNLSLFSVKVLSKKKKKKIINFIPFFLLRANRAFNSIKLFIKQLKQSKKSKVLKTYIRLQKFILSSEHNKENNYSFLKDSLHKLAYTKKSLSHYRWF